MGRWPFLFKGAEMSSRQFVGQLAAPEFPSDLEWINSDRPLTMKELQGKIVILDFWTYC